MCGEQNIIYKFFFVNIGSPPRVRGTAADQLATQSLYRITPACAGNSRRHEGTVCIRKDHPRVCGEQFPVFTDSLDAIGSPPRVRGTELFVVPLTFDAGITPACAGNSSRGR